MKTITSLQNPEIKSVAALHSKKGRTEQNKFMAEGLRAITTITNAGYKPLAIYATDKMFDHAAMLTDDDSATLVINEVMAKMSAATSPSGILALFAIPEPLAPHTLTPGLVLADIADPGNMGTLLRTCAAMNIKSVVLVEGTDPWSPKVVQASAGTIAQINIFSWDWVELLENKGNLQLHALVTHGGAQPSTVNPKFALLVIGNEAHGIDPQWLADCDAQITIPMPGNIESLNAAIAGSIAAYEVFGK